MRVLTIMNFGLIPCFPRLMIAFLLVVFCPSQASVWASNYDSSDARFSGPHGPKTAMSVPPHPGGPENKTAKRGYYKGAGRHSDKSPRSKRDKRKSDAARYAATVKSWDTGRGSRRSKKTFLFRRSNRRQEIYDRLAPGNCEGWDMAMTVVAALSCQQLDIWPGLRAQDGS